MNIKDKLKTLPLKPGCYLMKDKQGKVIYVGKAINLKNRVNSYFRGAHDYKTAKLVKNIADFDYIVVKSEKEALILEYNLIKKYDPYYNIVFKDDKSYPYILLKEGDIPCVEVARLKKHNRKYKGRLFGPYPDIKAARNMVSLINRLYPTKKCKNLGSHLCLYYHLNMCLGYCVKDYDKDACLKVKKNIISFLQGDTKKIIDDLKNKMEMASDKFDFKMAIIYRDLITDIKESTSKQVIELHEKESFDVFNYYVLDGYIAITGLNIRNGILLGSDKMLDYLVGDPENYVSSYLYQYYQINNTVKTLYVPENLLGYLQGLEGFEVLTSSKGKRYQLLQRALINSEETLRQNKEIITSKETYYENISNEFKKIFHKDIKHIELFDNSHLSGTNTVAAMVVYKNFKPSKKDYRMYKLDDGADDLKSMKEVIYRRYQKVLINNLKRPDLIIVDGGLIQIQAANEVLKSLDLNITLCGLGKDASHNTAYLMDANFEKIKISPDSDVFFFLANAQDEVHRFALSYQKKLRNKTLYRSLLDDVSGLGPKSKLKLLDKYKSISNIKKQSLEELKTVLNAKTAQNLYEKIHE